MRARNLKKVEVAVADNISIFTARLRGTFFISIRQKYILNESTERNLENGPLQY